jgi:two-component system nitrogen regulation response regulator NtrX
VFGVVEGADDRMSVSRDDGYVLVLDDEPPVRETLARYLQRRGYTVREARNAKEALDAVAPALRAAILDVLLINSGGKSGIDVLAAIRRSFHDIPVLMFTGFGLSPEVKAAIQEHGADLMHKPLSLRVLGEWLDDHVQE